MTAAEFAETVSARPGGAGQWTARCPGHEDNRASLSIGTGADGRILLKCFAGCTAAAIVGALGLTLRDLMPENTERPATGRRTIEETYDYCNATGELRYQNVRYRPKDFALRRPNGKRGWIWNIRGVARVPYRLPELIAAQPARLVITEGEKDCDRLWAAGMPATTIGSASITWTAPVIAQLPVCVTDIVVIPDQDTAGAKMADKAVEAFQKEGRRIRRLDLPPMSPGADVSDYLNMHPPDDLRALLDTTPTIMADHPPSVAPQTLADVDATFTKWLGEEYDLDALHIVLAVAAAEQLDGDPCWLNIISGPGNAKTETVQALVGAGAIVTSTISSEGALLSGTSKKEQATDATGGLLRRVGVRGIVVIKDLTSILSMNRDARAGVLAALREVYDGHWERNVGTDGGKSIGWVGRIVVIGACTTAWDRAHEVMAQMGDRFVLVRMDSTRGRLAAGRQAMANIGFEVAMRRELAAAVGGLLHGIRPEPSTALTDDEQTIVLNAANIVTLARTGVDYDLRGDVIDAHAPEAPTRFAKQLNQIMRGAIAIGLPRKTALGLAIRGARDSMSPLRLAILRDVAKNPGTLTRDVRKRLAKPRATVDRQLQALHILGLLACDEEETSDTFGKTSTLWRYRLREGIDPDVLEITTVPEMSAGSDAIGDADSLSKFSSAYTNKSGTVSDRTDQLKEVVRARRY